MSSSIPSILGVVTWKLGIVLRPSGASFPAHLTKAPTVNIPAREGEEDKLEAYQVKADKAAGIMWLMVEQAQRVHFRGIKDDAVKMWGVLEGVHMQKQPGTHFNAYDDLFSIRKREEEDLQSLINHVDDAIHLQSTILQEDVKHTVCDEEVIEQVVDQVAREKDKEEKEEAS